MVHNLIISTKGCRRISQLFSLWIFLLAFSHYKLSKAFKDTIMNISVSSWVFSSSEGKGRRFCFWQRKWKKNFSDFSPMVSPISYLGKGNNGTSKNKEIKEVCKPLLPLLIEGKNLEFLSPLVHLQLKSYRESFKGLVSIVYSIELRYQRKDCQMFSNQTWCRT